MIQFERSLALRGISIAAIVCFFAALAFPAVGTCYTPTSPLPNWFENSNILLFGWMAAPLGQLGWFANIPFFISAVAIIRGKCPALAFPILQAFFVLWAIVTLRRSFGMSLPHNEGFDEPVCWLEKGYWLWVAAQSTMCFASVAARFVSSKSEVEQ